jgi:hypothetical protein
MTVVVSHKRKHRDIRSGVLCTVDSRPRGTPAVDHAIQNPDCRTKKVVTVLWLVELGVCVRLSRFCVQSSVEGKGASPGAQCKLYTQHIT